MSDLLMLALIVAGFAAATVYAQFCDGLVRRPTGTAEREAAEVFCSSPGVRRLTPGGDKG